MELQLRNDLAEIPRLVEAFESFAETHGLSRKVAMETVLALDEVVTNVINHAWGDDRDHHCQVSFERSAEAVRITVEDDGAAFDPLNAKPPDLGAPLDDRPIGGLGIHLVKQFMDQVTYHRVEGKNRLVMEKRTEDDPAPA